MRVFKRICRRLDESLQKYAFKIDESFWLKSEMGNIEVFCSAENAEIKTVPQDFTM